MGGLKPSISAVLEKDDKDRKAMPLSNDTVRRRIDEMSDDIETQLVEKLKSRKISLQINALTVRGSETLLLTYVGYIDKGEFVEEILFCKSVDTTAADIYIYNKLKYYLDINNISMKNITSCAADGAPVMMGQKNGCLKLMKDEIPEMLIVHCVIHSENLVSKNISPVLNELLESVIKSINAIKANAKRKRP